MTTKNEPPLEGETPQTPAPEKSVPEETVPDIGHTEPDNAPASASAALLAGKLDAILQRLPAPKPARTGRLHKIADFIEAHSITRIVAVFGIWAVAVGLYVESGLRQEERAARAEEAEFRKLAQIATSWEVLLTPAGGDIGKGNAINTLTSGAGQLVGTDLSCERVGDFKSGECVIPPVFSGIVLGDDNFWEDDALRNECGLECEIKRYFEDVKLTQARIPDLRAEVLHIDENFDGVVGSSWVVRNAFMPGDVWAGRDAVSGFLCHGCVFHNSRLFLDGLVGSGFTTLVNSSVIIPQEDVGAHYDWSFETYLDQIVIFHKPLDEAVPNYLANGEFDEETLDDYVVWARYQAGHYCINPTDYNRLKGHIAEFRTLLNGQSRAAQQSVQSDRTEGMLGLVFIMDEVPDYLVTEDFDLISRYQPWFGPVGVPESLAGQSYACGLSYEEVEPLIRERVLDGLNARARF